MRKSSSYLVSLAVTIVQDLVWTLNIHIHLNKSFALGNTQVQKAPLQETLKEQRLSSLVGLCLGLRRGHGPIKTIQKLLLNVNVSGRADVRITVFILVVSKAYL